MRISLISLFAILIVSISSVQGEPTTQPTSQPSLAPGPGAALRSLFRHIDHQDRTKALACIRATTPLEIQVASSQVDLMIGVARLQKAVEDKLHADPSMLQMAVVSDELCSGISESITGDSATVTVTGEQNAAWTSDYDMVLANGVWKLSLSKNLRSTAPNATPAQVKALTNVLIQAVNNATDAVNRSELKTIDDVLRKISDAMPMAMPPH